MKIKCLRKPEPLGGILTDAGHRVQRGWLCLLAAEFIICSIYWSFWTRLWAKKGCQVIILLSQTSTYCSKESGKRNMWSFGSCRSLLTARSSSSELKRLSRSFIDTTKSVSWMRLVEAIRLWAAPRWASAQQYLVLTSRDLRYGSSQFHLKDMNTEWTLHKAMKYFFTQTYFNVPLMLPIFTCNFKLKEIIELVMAWRCYFHFTVCGWHGFYSSSCD